MGSDALSTASPALSCPVGLLPQRGFWRMELVDTWPGAVFNCV